MNEILPLSLVHEQPAENSQPLSTETIRLTHCAACTWPPKHVTLEHGLLILANDIPLDEKQRSELGRRATNMDAQVEFGEGHAVLQTMRGVGALLRSRTSWGLPTGIRSFAQSTNAPRSLHVSGSGRHPHTMVSHRTSALLR